MSREYTNRLHDLIDEDLDAQSVLSEMLCFFSEDQIKDFCQNSFGGEIEHLFKEVE